MNVLHLLILLDRSLGDPSLERKQRSRRESELVFRARPKVRAYPFGLNKANAEVVAELRVHATSGSRPEGCFFAAHSRRAGPFAACQAKQDMCEWNYPLISAIGK